MNNEVYYRIVRSILNLALVFVAYLGGLSAYAADVGFFTGSSFDSTIITGKVRVSCKQTTEIKQTVEFNCRSASLDPVEIDFFQGPSGIGADTVTLTAQLESGEIRKATSGYDSTAGRSTDKINLWIPGVVQKPLLAIGKTKVNYVLSFKNTIISQGNFVVTVNRNPQLTCPNSSYDSQNPWDCESQYSMCSRYFQDLNFCQ